MFVLFATKPLNDGTNGFRFNFLGVKGLTRKRTTTTRWGKHTGKSMNAYHLASVPFTLSKSLTALTLGVNLDTSQGNTEIDQ